MKKFDKRLSRSILCSLLAASVLGVCAGAQAATINGYEVEDGKITNDVINNDAHSAKLVIGQGNLDIQTTASVGGLILSLKDVTDKTDISSILGAIAPSDQNGTPLFGVVGGEGKLDSSTTAILTLAQVAGGKLGDYAKKLVAVNTAEESNITQNIGVSMGSEDSEPVIIGAVSGDVAVNTGLKGTSNLSNSETELTPEKVTLERAGNIITNIKSGNVFLASGSSTAIALGNMNVDGSASTEIEISGKKTTITATLNADLTGETETTLKGNVINNISSGANVAGSVTGGAALGVGGIATSTVEGNTTLNIASVVYDKELEGLTVGVAGGGAAISTIGGSATSEVTGSTTVNANNALSVGLVGGGVAAAVDGTQIGGLIKGNPIGNDEGRSDFDVNASSASATVTIKNVYDGGTANAKTGDTNISLTGTTTGIGVIGSGVAAATHSYTNRFGIADEKGTPIGSSVANVESGKTTISVNLEKEGAGFDPKLTEGLKNLVGNLNPKEENFIGSLQTSVGQLQDQSTVIALTGGGLAIAQDGDEVSTSEQVAEKTASSKASVTNEGADIDLASGYVVGAFGGGVAVAQNRGEALAETTGDINITVGENMEAVGLFGNGAAYFTGKALAGTRDLQGKAVVTAQNTTINVTGGSVDGLFGGGLAVDDSQSDTVNASVSTNVKSTINVTGGKVNELDYNGLKVVLTGDTSKPGNAAYLDAVSKVAEGVAIVGGGVAAGGGASVDVKESEINVAGGTVDGDILGGGITVYGYEQKSGDAGASVGTSTINLTGGEVTGSVYAGGIASGTDVSNNNYTQAKTTVGTAVINLAGTIVTGEISGQGKLVDGQTGTESTVGNSTLNVSGNNTLSPLADKAKINGFNTVNFAADSVTTLEGLTADGDTALIDAKLADGSKGDINVANGARLDVSNLNTLDTNEKGYLVAANYNDSSSTLWSDEALAFDRTEYYAYGKEDTDGYRVTYKDLSALTEAETEDAVEDMANSFGRYARYMDGLGREVITNSDEVAKQAPGAKAFFADATSLGSVAAAESAAAGMMMFGEASGVTSNAISIAQDMADTAALRLSFTQDYVTGDEKVDTDGNIWGRYVKNKHDVDGMSSSFGSIYSSSDYDGVMIGADFAKVGKAQSGIAFTYGDGDSHGAGVSNDFDMWGITLFGNIKNDDSNIIADIGYSKSSNDLTGSVMGKRLTADRDLDIFSVGVRAEKLYTNDNLQVVPYAGLRFFSVDPDSYTTYYNGQKAFSYDADRQNLWTLPMGVSLRHETTTNNGWKLTPQVDVSYIWAFGDTDNDMDVTLLGGRSHLNYTVMDSGSWLGTVAFEATKADWTCGLGYSYQKGSDMQSDKWFVNVEYSF